MTFGIRIRSLIAVSAILLLRIETVQSQNATSSVLLTIVTANSTTIEAVTTSTEKTLVSTKTPVEARTTLYTKKQPTNATQVQEARVPVIPVKSAGNTSQEEEVFHVSVCGRLPQPEQKHMKDCCRYQYRYFTRRWINGRYYLTTFLERMQRWGCDEFEIECRRPTWPFTEYTRSMYDLFCNRTILENRCQSKISEIVQKYSFLEVQSNGKTSPSTWKELIESLDSSQMEWRDLNEPCIEVALFDRNDGGVGRFHEIVESFTPFCGLQWNGYDYNTAMNRDVSPWTAMSIECRSSIIICMIIMAVAGFATIFANIIVLCVFGTTERLRNSQAIYKMSLAVADLMVGVIIWPNMIVMQYLTFMHPRKMGRIVENTTNRPPFTNQNLTYRLGGGAFQDIFPEGYRLCLGFFTLLSLMVSIYTLMVAGFDRFLAVFKPLRYNRFDAKRQAKFVCAVLWAISVIVSAIPTIIEEMKYQVISSVFITVDDDAGLILLLIAVFLPLIVTWVLTILMFRTSRRHARSRQKIVSANATSSQDLERRLAKTLSMMVGVFTLSVMPTVFCIIPGFASKVTTWSQPWNLSIPAATAYTTSEYLAVIILTSNSLWNCFIYSLRTRGFRDAARAIIKSAAQKSGFQFIRRHAIQVLHGARRVSLSSMLHMRRFSSPEVSDSRKKSVSSLNTGMSKVSEMNSSSAGRPSVDLGDSSILAQSSSNDLTSVYAKSSSKGGKVTSGVEIRAERKKQQKKEDDEYVGEDSTFGSFAIPVGADRLFESVMENVPELDEIDNDEDVNKEK